MFLNFHALLQLEFLNLNIVKVLDIVFLKRILLLIRTQIVEIPPACIVHPYPNPVRGSEINDNVRESKWFRGEWKGDDHAWLVQGGIMTQRDYHDEENLLTDIIKKHHEELEKSVLYHIDRRGNLYIHGGIDWGLPIDEQDEETYYWDRDTFLVEAMMNEENGTEFPNTNVFVGHCNTLALAGTARPVRLANL